MTRLTGRRLFSFRAFAVNVGVVAVAFFAGLLLDLRFWGLSLLTQWRLIVVLLLVVSVPSYYTFWVSTTLLRWTAAKRLSLSRPYLLLHARRRRYIRCLQPVLRANGIYLLQSCLSNCLWRVIRQRGSSDVPLPYGCAPCDSNREGIRCCGMGSLVTVPDLSVLSLLKAGRWLVQPIITVLCERLYESKQGVLSQVGLGVAALAKIVQESLKHLGYLTVH